MIAQQQQAAAVSNIAVMHDMHEYVLQAVHCILFQVVSMLVLLFLMCSQYASQADSY
jgi:hypothetical protein